MIKNGKLWFLFVIDPDADQCINVGLYHSLQDAIDSVKVHSNYAPFVQHYYIATIDLSDCLSIMYDDHKILLS